MSDTDVKVHLDWLRTACASGRVSVDGAISVLLILLAGLPAEITAGGDFDREVERARKLEPHKALDRLSAVALLCSEHPRCGDVCASFREYAQLTADAAGEIALRRTMTEPTRGAVLSAAATADAALRRGEELARPRRSPKARLLILLAFHSVARQALARALRALPVGASDAPGDESEGATRCSTCGHTEEQHARKGADGTCSECSCADFDVARDTCPGEQTLLDFAAGGLSPEAIDHLEHHLDGCRMCLDLLVTAVELGEAERSTPALPREAIEALLPRPRGGA